MKILLLQDEIFIPSLAGGTKANRFLLEAFARRGHDCLALTRALTRSPDGPNDRSQFMEELRSRGAGVQEIEENVFSFDHLGVAVDALDCHSDDLRRDYIVRRIGTFRPDWVLVADDKRRFMLEGAMHAAAARVVPLLQTIMQLPFGPLSVHQCETQARLMSEATAIIVISDFLKQYIADHGHMESHVLHMPVYGEGPYPDYGRFEGGFVTMINPCDLKGVDIFLALAREFPDVEFAAVPTWGRNDRLLRNLHEQANVHVLPATDDIGDILAQTRVLLAPSLWPETFGYVVPEAMLRGIPVLASNLGGLPEAKLGVDYLLPVAPAERRGDTYVCPTQDVRPWSAALKQLLSDAAVYASCSQKSRAAALQFVSDASVMQFESFLAGLTAD